MHNVSVVQEAVVEERSCNAKFGIHHRLLPLISPSKIMEQSSVIFGALMQFRNEDPDSCARVWGDPDRFLTA